MEEDNLYNMILLLDNARDNCSDDDFNKMQTLYDGLINIDKVLPNEHELEEFQKIATDLEVKYDSLIDLGYYFDPLYVEIKDKIKQEYIKKLREENRRK